MLLVIKKHWNEQRNSCYKYNLEVFCWLIARNRAGVNKMQVLYN